MKTPVLIAAHNEEAHIGRCLSRLDADTVEPVVIVNGSTDATADIARGFGAAVLEREEQGKLPALQAGLRYLGERALGPVLFTDADTYPLFPRRWAPAMARHLDTGEIPSGVSGVHAYFDGRQPETLIRSVRRYEQFWRAAQQGINKTHGFNMGTRFQRPELLDEILELPHTWPGEDRLITDIVIDRGGEFTQTLDPRSLVMTSARYHRPLLERLKRGKHDMFSVTHGDYVRRAAPTVEAAYIGNRLEAVETT